MAIIKAFVAVVIVLVILFVFLGSDPIVSDFVNRIGNVFPMQDSTPGSLAFSLALTTSDDLSFSITDPANVTVRGISRGSLGNAPIATERMLMVTAFTGTMSLTGNELHMNGSAAGIVLPDITLPLRESFMLESTLDTLEITDLRIRELHIEDSLGSLTVADTTTSFSDPVTVRSFSGTLFFDEQLVFDGHAAHIAIPAAGISIS